MPMVFAHAPNRARYTDTTNQSWTDLAIHATVNTKVKSAGTPFRAADVGKVLTVSAGTNWTTGDYAITAGPDAQGYVTLASSPSAAGNGNAGTGNISWHRLNCKWSDLQVHGTTNTKVKSALLPFKDSDQLKTLTITGGTSWTAGDYTITTSPDNEGYVTLSASPGATSLTGGQGTIGTCPWPSRQCDGASTQQYVQLRSQTSSRADGSVFLYVSNWKSATPPTDTDGAYLVSVGSGIEEPGPLANLWVRKTVQSDYVAAIVGY